MTTAGELLTYAEAARRRGKSVRTIKRWAGAGVLDTVGRGPGRKITAESLERHRLAETVVARTPEVFGARLADERNRKALREFLAPFIQEEVERQVRPLRERLERLEREMAHSKSQMADAA